MVLDVTTTAMPRPDIHRRTFESFCNKLRGVEWSQCTLYINIDPFPEGSKVPHVDRIDCVNMAKRYFGKVVANMPDEPNYSEAYNWVWSKAKTQYILNLEDDWELIRPIDIRHLIDVFENNPDPGLYQVVLRAYDYDYPCNCTSPSILHKRFYKAWAGKLLLNVNPETQIHHHGARVGLPDIPFKKSRTRPSTRVIAWPRNLKLMAVRDLGRENIGTLGCKFPEGKKRDFVRWEAA